MFIKEEISDKEKDFQSLCKGHTIKYIYAFGSTVTTRFDKDHSDIDLLVDIDTPDPVERGKTLISLWDSFELFFQKMLICLRNHRFIIHI